MTDSRPPASMEPAQTMPAGVPVPAGRVQADSGPRMAAEAYRHAALLVQLGLDGLRAHGGRSTQVFEDLVIVLEQMARYAEAGTVPGDPMPEPAVTVCAVDESGGMADMAEEAGRARARLELSRLAAQWRRPAGLGHELSAHRDLGFCAACAPDGFKRTMDELVGWRLLAIAERGVPEQP